MNADIVTTVLTALILAVVCRTVWDVLDQSPPTNSENTPISRFAAVADPMTAANLDFDIAGRPGKNLPENNANLTPEIARQIDELRAVDDSFDADKFLSGSRIVFETIVVAFANGDRDILRDLLSPEVYEIFDREIQARESQGQRVALSFVCLKKPEIVGAHTSGGRTEIAVNFISELVTATYDGNGNVVAGDPAKVVAMHDCWTFARELNSFSPSWKLIETE